MYTKTAANVLCPDHVEGRQHPSREMQLIPQKAREFPPLGHFLHFFLVLRCTLQGFYERDVDFGAFEEFPDGVGCEY